jgi:hypothetical protein
MGTGHLIQGDARRRAGIATAVISATLAACLGGAPGASAEMRSEKISKNVCKTTGGGKFVRIPHSGGERIDRRLLPDVRWMRRKFDIGIGDGYALSGHAANGEHPIGAALDIFSGNGRNSGWNKVDKLADLAEPRQNRPILPWRWVGYDGDAGHGRGHHLHLSWAHSDNTTPGKPAKWVLSRKCPGGGGDGDGSADDGGGISTSKASFPGMAPAVPETP